MTHTPPPTQDDLAAGRELDILIAEKVMGWHMAKRPNGEGWPPSQYWQGLHHRKVPPPYSTDISAAWQVVEHLILQGHQFGMTRTSQGWRAFARGDVWLAPSDTAPLAICRAALAAVSG